MKFEAFVALRYLRGKRKTRFVNLITVLTIAGVTVGVMALIVVMSVMSGFDLEFTRSLLANRAHLFVQEEHGTMKDPDKVIDDLKKVCPEIIAASPIIQLEALLKTSNGRYGEFYTGAYIRGIDPERESAVTDIQQNLEDRDGRIHARGKLPGHKEIVLGYLLAEKLGVDVGDTLAVVTPKSKTTPMGRRMGQEVYVTVSGIAEAKMTDFDSIYAYLDLDTARMLRDDEGVDGIHCRLTDESAEAAAIAADKVRRVLKLLPTTWYEDQRAYFEALKQEKVAMFIILVFIILVAAFNIMSTLIMLVMEKRRDIGILRTIGSSSSSILLVFILEGLYIGLSGTFLGVVLGTLTAYNITPVAKVLAWILRIDLFNSQIYFFEHMPVAVIWGDIFKITLCSVLLTFLSTLYPAWSASRLNPVDALRYE